MLGPIRSACGRPAGRKSYLQERLVVAGREQRRVKITPRTAGTSGCLVVAVLCYSAVTITDRGHSDIGRQWLPAVLIGGGTPIGLLALIGALLALGRRRPRASRALYPVGMGLMGALALIAWAGIHLAGRQRPGDQRVAGRPRSRRCATGRPGAGHHSPADLAAASTGRSRCRAWQTRDRGDHQRAPRWLVRQLDRYRPAAGDATGPDPDQRGGRREPCPRRSGPAAPGRG